MSQIIYKLFYYVTLLLLYCYINYIMLYHTVIIYILCCNYTIMLQITNNLESRGRKISQVRILLEELEES